MFIIIIVLVCVNFAGNLCSFCFVARLVNVNLQAEVYC
jgi:hypothetical protein